MKLSKLKINIFADGADFNLIRKYNKFPLIKGFTTNPSLMYKSKIKNYKNFANKVIRMVNKKSLSFEVTADEKFDMLRQADEISSWSKNVYVKIPFTNSKGVKNVAIIKELAERKRKINVTSIFTIKQVKEILNTIPIKSDMYLSIFAGRIADTGIDPKITIRKAVKLSKKYKNLKILWASCREPYSIIEANQCGCHIITVPNSMISKLKLFGKNLEKYSVETSRDFFIDSQQIKW